MRPIQEFSEDELVEELMSRYDDIVIGARKVLTTGDDPSSLRTRWWKGDLDACIGIIQSVSSTLIDHIYKKNGFDNE